MIGLASGAMAATGLAPAGHGMPWWQVPEFCWLLVGTVLLLGGCWGPEPLRGRAGAVSTAFFGLMFIVGLFFWRPGGEAFGGFYRWDGLAILFKRLFLFGGLIASWMMLRSPDGPRSERIEYVALPWFAVLAMGLMASAGDFAVLFVSLETLTITSYILVSLERDRATSLEAGIKYLIMGGLSAAFLVYGIALLYGTCGTLRFDEMASRLPGALAGELGPVARAGLLCVMVAVAFKVAAAPFQWWVPDVYQGAPVPITGFLAVASKAAGFAVLLRLLWGPFAGVREALVPMIAWLAAASIVVGNFGALSQRNLKRLMGYSGVSHAGYLLMGVAAGTAAGVEAVIYYLIGYAAAVFVVLGLLAGLVDRLGGADLRHLNGLAKREPGLAWLMLVGLASLAGLPPLVGFLGKWLVFVAAFQAGLVWLVIVACVGVVASLYYYLAPVRGMFFEPPPPDAPSLELDIPYRTCISVLMGITIILGVAPGPVVAAIGGLLAGQ
ncbi:MAG TPA: NADH-quinone oxidoreductase subunit N [Verrucomicrobiae bacterium]|nr:NADH-quinone oxidoreductase subunit N [Verrucomicrobiae bacterium]